MDETARLRVDEWLQEWDTPPVEAGERVQAKPLDDAMAEWGTSPEAEAGLWAHIGSGGGLVTA